jgi:predicted DNA-binding transcriptional regulator AlpA
MPKTIEGAQKRAAITNPDKVVLLLKVISHGSGDELLNVDELKVTGSHPFSNSTRQRKIRNKQFPAPIKVSSQMSLWRVADIRSWRINPSGYKAKVMKGGSK